MSDDSDVLKRKPLQEDTERIIKGSNLHVSLAPVIFILAVQRASDMNGCRPAAVVGSKAGPCQGARAAPHELTWKEPDGYWCLTATQAFRKQHMERL